MEKTECLSQCTYQDGVIKLPDVQLDRKVYMAVKKTLEGIGAKWKGGKTQGFVLGEDKAELFARLQDNPDYNYQQSTQFFETPPAVCDQIRCMIALLYDDYDSFDDIRILEPSAGRGALINTIHNYQINATIHYCELDSYNQSVLQEIWNTEFLCDDFMQLDEKEKFDLIVANPPFTRGTAQKHLAKMTKHLKENGEIICVMPEGWRERYTKELEVLEDQEDLFFKERACPDKAFKSSGTNIKTVIVVIQKY